MKNVRMWRTLLGLAALLLATSPTMGQALERLSYNDDELRVDLGVGLWAWPLPTDYDGDGRTDLIVVCTDTPYNGVYFFRNTGEVDDQTGLPIFDAAERLGSAVGNPQVSYVAGEPVVTSPGKVYPDFAETAFEEPVDLPAPANVHNLEGNIRANQWRYVDYNGDGLQDLIVGIGHWGDYGWDDAYNDRGQWTRGPLHGYVYLLLNTGTDDEPDYAEPERLRTMDGSPIDVFGMPSPNFAEFTGDGKLDLICGEFRDGFTFYKNVGTREKPIYAPGRPLTHNDRRIAMDLCMITPTAFDFTGNGWPDLIVGDEDGRVALVEHTGEIVDGVPRFLPPRYFRQRADDVKFGALSTPVGYDWNGDGRDDILVGNTAGQIAFIENRGGDPVRWAPPKLLEADGEVIQIMAGPNGSIQGPAEAKWGYTTLSVADWNHDGLPDVVVNSIWGKVVWYENVGTRERPKLAAAEPIEVDWPREPPKPAWNWWEPRGNALVTQWRTTPVAIDWTGNGLADLVMLDHEGYLALFRRVERDGRAVLLPGERVFRMEGESEPLRLNANRAGGSGRRKLSVVDFDGDGRLDVLVNSMNASLLRNVGEEDGMTILRDYGPLDGRRLSSHTTSPTTIDLAGDGVPELLIGAEDGYLYHASNPLRGPADVSLARADVVVEGRRCEVGTLGEGERAFGNRDYVWRDVPGEFDGWTIVRTRGGVAAMVEVTARRDTTLHLATAAAQGGIDLAGWEEVEGATFNYTDAGRTEVRVHRRKLAAGETCIIPQGNWTGGILLLAPEE